MTLALRTKTLLPLFSSASLLLTAVILVACADKNADSSTPDNSIPLMYIGQITDTANATPLPEAAAGVRAAVEGINAAGGLLGRPLSLTICDDRADANEAAKCARKAARSKVVATLGNSSNFGNVILPVLTQAGIASLGHNPISSQDFASPVAFPIQGGSPSSIAGAAKLLAEQGVKRIRIAGVDSPAGAVAEQFANVGLKGTDTRIVGMTPVPIGAPDYAIYANTVLQGSDGVMVSMNADQSARFITALRQADAHIPIAVTMTSLPPTTIKQLANAAEGIVVSMVFLPLTAGGTTIEHFLADMQRYAPKERLNSFSLQTWLAAQLFVSAVNEAANKSAAAQQDFVINAASVMQLLSQLDNFSIGNAMPPMTTTAERKPPFNRLFNNKVLFGKVVNGEMILLDEEWKAIELGE